MKPKKGSIWKKVVVNACAVGLAYVALGTCVIPGEIYVCGPDIADLPGPGVDWSSDNSPNDELTDTWDTNGCGTGREVNTNLENTQCHANLIVGQFGETDVRLCPIKCGLSLYYLGSTCQMNASGHP